MPSPYMGLSLPTPGPNSAVPDWGNLLNTAFALIDSHDHTPGHGLPVPTAGISINADLTFGGFNLTQARTLRLQPQSAAPSLASDAGCLYLTSAGDLWWNNGAGQHIQITSGTALAASSLGGISGLGGTSAGVAFSNSTKTFTFTQAANQSALLDAGPLVIHDTAASAFGITLQSPVGIAGAYALTLPAALPAATSVLTVSATGQLAAGPATSSLLDSTWFAASGAASNLSVTTNAASSIWTKATLSLSNTSSTGTNAPTWDNANSKIIINKAGTYALTLMGAVSASVAGQFVLMFFKNGTSLFPTAFSGPTFNVITAGSSYNGTGLVRMIVTLAATDFIEVYAISPTGVSSLLGMQYGSLTVERVA